jgi:hypothetical protein
MKVKVTAILAAAIASLVLVGTALAWTYDQAATTMYYTTKYRAACGQGYWSCSTYTLLSMQKLSTLYPQWRGAANIFRFHGGTSQLCLVTAEINSNGTIYESGVSCKNLSYG